MIRIYIDEKRSSNFVSRVFGHSIIFLFASDSNQKIAKALARAQDKSEDEKSYHQQLVIWGLSETVFQKYSEVYKLILVLAVIINIQGILFII